MKRILCLALLLCAGCAGSKDRVRVSVEGAQSDRVTITAHYEAEWTR